MHTYNGIRVIGKTVSHVKTHYKLGKRVIIVPRCKKVQECTKCWVVVKIKYNSSTPTKHYLKYFNINL